LPTHIKPAIGGLGVGLIALAYPQVLSMGYGWLQFAIDGNTAELTVGTMLALVALKIVTTSFTIGTGGSGGVFAPGLFIGGMLGGAMWGGLHAHVGWMPATAAPFVIVGMMALFGGIAHAPLAVMLMVAEMTGEFSMVVPAMVAVGIAYFVAGDVSIYENQLRTRADSPAHRGEYTIPLMQVLEVGQAMRRNVQTALPDELAHVAERRMLDRGLRGLPVVVDGRLCGMFTMTDAFAAERDGKPLVRDAMTSTDLAVAHPDESLHTALQRMANRGISRLPVTARDNHDRLEGILTIRDLAVILNSEAERRAIPETAPAIVVSRGQLDRIRIASEGPLAGKQIREVGFPEGSLIVSVRRDSQNLVPRAGMGLEPGDELVILAEPDARNQLVQRNIIGTLDRTGEAHNGLRNAYERILHRREPSSEARPADEA
jgi:CIC family chloride channel protein